jgi:heme exporter protein D
LISFAVLYAAIKMQLVKEQIKFNAKFVSLTSDKIQSAKAQETYREILANTSISKV